MSIVTRTGDHGTTGLYGAARVSKATLRIGAIGDVDELNALIGCVRCESVSPEIETVLESIQHRLFTLGADLATPLSSPAPTHRVTVAHVEVLDAWIARIEPMLPALTSFILPSGSRAGALLHHARTVCRRAERSVVALKEHEEINPETAVYLNRLGDLLFTIARLSNLQDGKTEEGVKYE